MMKKILLSVFFVLLLAGSTAIILHRHRQKIQLDISAFFQEADEHVRNKFGDGFCIDSVAPDFTRGFFDPLYYAQATSSGKVPFRVAKNPTTGEIYDNYYSAYWKTTSEQHFARYVKSLDLSWKPGFLGVCKYYLNRDPDGVTDFTEFAKYVDTATCDFTFDHEFGDPDEEYALVEKILNYFPYCPIPYGIIRIHYAGNDKLLVFKNDDLRHPPDKSAFDNYWEPDFGPQIISNS